MTTTNGTTTQRKTLSTQLDRLDDILDCLGDGLNEAVRDAVKEAVGEAVRVSVRETLQAVLQEIANHPDILATVRKLVVPPESEPMPTQPPQLEQTFKQHSPSRAWGARMLAWAGPMLCSKWDKAKDIAKAGLRSCKVLWQHRGSVLSLTTVGVAIGFGSFLMGPLWSAVLAGFGGVSTAVLAVAAVALWRVCNLAQGLGQAA